ncbi:membrane dipeptidase family protein [Mycobacterium ulcerans str. Harvey]|uniref:Membrane dipeptidase family protein n=1 Tax=Mycobacterium ulcerans str. Harvey TaxID=1299332 RepID=A0ABP3ATW9_MYCUL|nr:membrane dipeptidase family protein [Mycobacterium ulcerans str. Harvey]
MSAATDRHLGRTADPVPRSRHGGVGIGQRRVFAAQLPRHDGAAGSLPRRDQRPPRSGAGRRRRRCHHHHPRRAHRGGLRPGGLPPLDNLATLADLGVRTLLPTYNHANRAGSGCLDTTDAGLTGWGRAIVAEMNGVGIVPDGSHCSTRTGLDMCEVSTGPVVYSHSCMRAVWDHPRNITDDQARACAATGGVIGITGVGIFLGPNTPTLDAMTRRLEYAVDLVGIDHVGISSDFSFDLADFYDELTRNPDLFDESYTRWDRSSGWRPKRCSHSVRTSPTGAGPTITSTRCSAPTSIEWRNASGPPDNPATIVPATTLILAQLIGRHLTLRSGSGNGVRSTIRSNRVFGQIPRMPPGCAQSAHP